MIALTGATGFLGGHVLRKLGTSEATVRCLVRPGTPPDRLPCVPGLKLDVRELPFTHAQAVREALSGVETVIHAAALLRGSAAAMVADTVVGSEGLYRAAVDCGVRRFVLVSSLAVLAVAHLRRGAVVTGTLPLDGHPELRDGYTFSKHRQERLARTYESEHGLPLVVVRPGVVLGTGRSPLNPRIGVRFGRYFVHLGFRNRIPFTYVENCAEALVLAAAAPGLEGKSVSIVDDDLPRSSHVLRQYQRYIERLRVLPFPYPILMALARTASWSRQRYRRTDIPMWTPHQVASMWRPLRFANDDAKALLGWTPAVGMDEALRRTCQSLARSAAALRKVA